MSDWNEIFPAGYDLSTAPDDGGFDPLPAGWYPAMIDTAEVVDTRVRDGKRLKLCFTIAGDKFNGRKVWGGINLRLPSAKATEIGLRELAHLARAAGLTVVHDSAEFCGKYIMIKLAIRNEPGREPDNEIKGYKAIATAANVAPPTRPAPAPAVYPAQIPAPVTAPAALAPMPWEKAPAPAPVPAPEPDETLPF